MIFEGVVAALLLSAEGLSKDAIMQVVKRHQNEVKFCYEQQLQEQPSLKGKVAVAFTVGPDGKVLQANATQDTFPDAAVADCIVARVRRWEFPKPEGGGEVTVTFPWVFKPADDVDAAEEPIPQPQPRSTDDADAPPAPAPPDAAEAQRSADERRREAEEWERAHPPGLGEMWAMGGAGMYPPALALFAGLIAGALALLLALARVPRPAVMLAGLAVGCGAAGLSTGILGTVNGLMGSYKAVAHVAPVDREFIMEVARHEASMCWKLGAITFATCGLLGAAAAAAALARARKATSGEAP